MHVPARQRDSPKPPKVAGFLTQSILLDHNLLALAARKSAALAGRPALFARASRQKENAARHLTSPVGVAPETGDYGGAFGRGASVLEGAAMRISAANHTGKMPH